MNLPNGGYSIVTGKPEYRRASFFRRVVRSLRSGPVVLGLGAYLCGPDEDMVRSGAEWCVLARSGAEWFVYLCPCFSVRLFVLQFFCGFLFVCLSVNLLFGLFACNACGYVHVDRHIYRFSGFRALGTDLCERFCSHFLLF